MAVLQSITNSNTELLARIERLEAENAKLKASKAGRLSMKVSEKGAVSLFGMGKWPVTLYRQQWERVLGAKDEILAFIEAHAGELSVKE